MKKIKESLLASFFIFLMLSAQRFFHVIPNLPRGDNTGLVVGFAVSFIFILVLNVIFSGFERTGKRKKE